MNLPEKTLCSAEEETQPASRLEEPDSQPFWCQEPCNITVSKCKYSPQALVIHRSNQGHPVPRKRPIGTLLPANHTSDRVKTTRSACSCSTIYLSFRAMKIKWSSHKKTFPKFHSIFNLISLAINLKEAKPYNFSFKSHLPLGHSQPKEESRNLSIPSWFALFSLKKFIVRNKSYPGVLRCSSSIESPYICTAASCQKQGFRALLVVKLLQTKSI